MISLIYKPLEFTAAPNGRAEIITTPFIRGMWDDTTSELMTFFTSSLQTTASQEYYYEIWSSSSLSCENREKVFSVAYGHVSGSGSRYNNANIENTSGDTPSKSIYNQFKQMCLDGDEGGLKLSGSALPLTHFYVVSINRDKFGDKLDPGNFELNLVELSGSGVPNNLFTGSRVVPSGSNPKLISLIDDSGDISNNAPDESSIATSVPRYIVSGSLSNGIHNTSAPHQYGIVYPSLGIMILDADKLNLSASFNSVTGSNVNGDNSFKLFTSISGAAALTSNGFNARSIDVKNESHFYVRIKTTPYGYGSNNPTFVAPANTVDQETGVSATGLIKYNEWRAKASGVSGKPTVYITSIGLYDNDKNLLAVAKMSKPVRHDINEELSITVKLEY
jgi:hypothetical protein